MSVGRNVVLARNSSWSVVIESLSRPSTLFANLLVFVPAAVFGAGRCHVLPASILPTLTTCFALHEARLIAEHGNRKDKTLIEILDRLKSLEGKVDNLSVQGTVTSSEHDSVSSHPLVQTPEAAGVHSSGTVLPPPLPESLEPSGDASFYKYTSSVNGMLAWPAVQELLTGVFPTAYGQHPSVIDQIGSVSVLLNLQDQSTALPTTAISAGPGTSSFHSQTFSNTAVMPRVETPLNWESMQNLSTAFFETFNLLHPIIDRQHFLATTLPTILINGLDDSVEATLAFLIFALGEVAIAGTIPTATSRHDRSNSHPPGLLLFNEARRRIGFHVASCALTTVQILTLTGIYYGTAFHHTELWRSAASASLACQALISASRPEELRQPHRDILRRVFWHCSIMETFIELEFGLPATGLNAYEGRVPVPDFGGGFAGEDHVANQTSRFQEHYASQIVLRRLATEFHTVLTGVPLSTGARINETTTPVGKMPETIRSLATQLDHWRETLLPAHLHWREEEPDSFPGPTGPQQIYGVTTVDAAESSNTRVGGGGRAPMFGPTHATQQPVCYPYAMDIQVALLRSRYYAIKHQIYRTYLYKALHHPSALTQDDAEGIATCLRTCLRWPVAMSPVCQGQRKRLIPCVFFWTQNLLGVLIVLWLSERVDVLRRVRSSGLCGKRFEDQAAETVRVAVQWLRDLAEDGMEGQAADAWRVVKGIYGLAE